MPSVLAISRAMASSTSSPAAGSPRQLTDSSIALWARCRGRSGGTTRSPPPPGRGTAPRSRARSPAGASRPSTSPCPAAARRWGRAAPPARPAARPAAGVELGPLVGPAPSASRTSGCAGSARCRAPRPPPNDVTPAGLNGPVAVVDPPVCSSCPDLAAPPVARSWSRVPQPTAARGRAPVDQAVGRWRHRRGGGARPAVAGGAGRPRRGRGRRQRPRAARLRPRPRRAVARLRGPARRDEAAA